MLHAARGHNQGISLVVYLEAPVQVLAPEQQLLDGGEELVERLEGGLGGEALAAGSRGGEPGEAGHVQPDEADAREAPGAGDGEAAAHRVPHTRHDWKGRGEKGEK